MHLPYLHALDGIPFDGYVTMLEYAGIGVAMGNACDATKPPRIMSPTTLPQTPCKGTDAFWPDLNKLSFPQRENALQGPHICGPQLYGR